MDLYDNIDLPFIYNYYHKIYENIELNDSNYVHKFDSMFINGNIFYKKLIKIK